MNDFSFAKEVATPQLMFLKLKKLRRKIYLFKNLGKILKYTLSILSSIFVFYQKKVFQNLSKMIFISSKKLFSFSTYLILSIFSSSFPQLPDSNGSHLLKKFSMERNS